VQRLRRTDPGFRKRILSTLSTEHPVTDIILPSDVYQVEPSGVGTYLAAHYRPDPDDGTGTVWHVVRIQEALNRPQALAILDAWRGDGT